MEIQYCTRWNVKNIKEKGKKGDELLSPIQIKK